MSWLFSRALVEEYSGGSSSGGEPSAPLSLMPTAQPFLRNGKTTGFSGPSQYGLTCERLTADRGVAVLTWYLAAFPAKTSAPPDVAPASVANALDSGWKWPGSSAKFDPDTCSWRTRQSSLLGGLSEFSETWPRWGSMRDGELLPRQTPELRTSATASGFWPTPVAQDDNKSPEAHMAMKRRMKGGPRNTITSLQVAAKAWATPAARDHFPAHTEQYIATKRAEGHGMRNLVDEAKAWGTPTAMDHKDSGDCSNVPDNGLLGRMVKRWSGTTAQSGSLNPDFHLWLMGWPEGWNALEPLETGRFQQWLRSHGEF